MTTQDITTLPVAERAQIALKSTETEKAIQALVTKAKPITQVSDKNGRELAHSVAMELRSARVTIEKTGKAARDDATKFSGAVIAEEKRLIATIKPEEERVLALRDAWDAEQERIKQARIEAERRRVQKIQDAITTIRNFPLRLVGKSSADTDAAVCEMEALPVDEAEFQEFTAEAVRAKSEALAQLHQVHAAARAAEVARAEAEEARRQAEAERAEQARIQAERDAELAALRAKMKAHEEALQKQAEQQAAAELAQAKANPDGQELSPAAQALHEAQGAANFAKRHPGIAAAVAAPAQTPATAPKPARPTDDEIIDVLALHYRVHESKVIEWLLDMDLASASERMVEAV